MFLQAVLKPCAWALPKWHFVTVLFRARSETVLGFALGRAVVVICGNRVPWSGENRQKSSFCARSLNRARECLVSGALCRHFSEPVPMACSALVSVERLGYLQWERTPKKLVFRAWSLSRARGLVGTVTSGKQFFETIKKQCSDPF